MTKTKWALDATHSEVQFKVRHMMITSVTGEFKKFNANVETEGEDFTTAKIEFTADINSISTNNEQRDGHLKSPDFFDATSYPELKFEGKKLEKLNDETYKLSGNLNMRGITKAITLNVEFGGMIKDPWGNMRVGFSVDGKINRKDFGLQWHAVTETGGLVVSDEVRIHVAAEFIKQAEQAVTMAA
jgi:polyisoprenoid-binding protein YceI